MMDERKNEKRMATNATPLARKRLWAVAPLVIAVAALGRAAVGDAPVKEPVAPAAPLAEVAERADLVAPIPEPMPTELPAWASAYPSDEGLGNAARDEIAHDARKLATRLPQGSALRAQLFASFAANPRCGRAHAAAVTGAFAAATADEIDGVLATMHTSCDEVVVEAAGFAPAPSKALAKRLVGLAEGSRSDAVRRAAWLAYGSLGETAGRTGDGALANEIQAKTLQFLRGAKGEARLVAIKTAGNAACASCTGELAKDLLSKEPSVRAIAAAAHRFVDDAASVATMCKVLSRDGDDGARDAAAWGLEWRGGSMKERVACLETAAKNDPSRRVRVQAALAVAGLADGSEEAADGLARLAVAGPEEVRGVAVSAIASRERADDAALALGE